MTEINELNFEQISNQIRKGYTSGRVDCGDNKHISWDFTTEVRIDDNNQDEPLNKNNHLTFIKRTFDMIKLQKDEFGRKILRISGNFHHKLCNILCKVLSSKDKENYLYSFLLDIKHFPNGTIFSE